MSSGVIVASTDLWNTGGYTYLHKRIPFLAPGQQGRTDVANYVIARTKDAPRGAFSQVSTHGDWGVYRRPGPCAPMPEFRADLN